ncbi:MAG: L,D-transpeptidase [Opitutales bacterium]|nr:L,D-transpeptidase [Opitutales bacterium]
MSIPSTRVCLGVVIDSQQMCVIENSKVVRMYSVSTSRQAPSCIEDSLGTPLGLHSIAKKIGKGEKEGMVFRGRIPTGKCFFEYDEESNKENLITSRILRLRGVENNVNAGGNCDSWNRYIYIHGTNHEEKIGAPVSSGCVQLINKEILELFDLVDEGSLVLIEREFIDK